MTEQKLNRRAFFERAALIGATAIGAGTFLAACDSGKAGAKGGDKAGGGTKAAAPAKTDCTDVSKLSDGDKKMRESLKYIDVSAKPDQNCENCKLFVKKDPCNGCSVVKGPIAAKGWCSAWAKA